MVLDFIISMILLIGVISLFNLIRYLLKIRKIIKMHKNNPNIQGISIINGDIRIVEKKPEPEFREQEKPTFKDEICGRLVKEEEAYRVLADGETHYFCSWECREAYIKKRKEGD